KFVAYMIILTQLLPPGFAILPSSVFAADSYSDNQSTLQGLDSLILGHEPASGMGRTVQGVTLPSISHDRIRSGAGLDEHEGAQATSNTNSNLPELPTGTSQGSQPDDRSEEDNSSSGYSTFASQVSQAGSILSQQNSTDAAINYARGLGEGLINQQVNDWLGQFGNAKVSVGSNKKISGDMLLPVYETDNSIVFSQFGARNNQDRNTLNIGLGYRHYLNDWMLGINTFYDYDYTGKNKRLGVGTEAWADYLKLAANGYIRQTDWHQSKMEGMKDYDERPANGFDLRANAYLPSWPNLGGNLKYEQYFGKGVSVSGSASPDSLKDNPVIITAGVDYTPFPLMT
ncbi:TPA: inverse autotransporter beta domain-containing protein, partial [Enterobacter roggenkampii]|nr:inverse autotransporter beta domain-containing protein [Enterobacter roggenkampii]